MGHLYCTKKRHGCQQLKCQYFISPYTDVADFRLLNLKIKTYHYKRRN